MNELTKSNNPKAIILSIKPTWADMIMSGKKHIELRRRFTNLSQVSTRALLYASTPVKAIVGIVSIDRVMTLPPEELWPHVAEGAAVAYDDYVCYFKDAPLTTALFLDNPVELKHPIGLADLRLELEFTPPMSWRWMKPKENELLRRVAK